MYLGITISADMKVSETVDLGITISSDMKISEQCGIVASKGNQSIGLIRRNVTYKENS